MKKTILFSICLVMLNLDSFAQGLTSVDVASERLYMASDASKPIDALGSPYVNENFLPVKIKGYDNQLYTGRFNAYNGEMEINLGSKIIALDKSKPFEVMFTQNNSIYRTFKYSTASGIYKSGFLNIVEENKSYALLKEESVKYQEKIPAATSYQQDKPAKFIKEDSNYYIKKGEIITPLPTKKKDLLKAFSKNAKNIKSYLKQDKISLKKEEDLKKLAAFISNM